MLTTYVQVFCPFAPLLDLRPVGRRGAKRRAMRAVKAARRAGYAVPPALVRECRRMAPALA